MSTLMDIYKHFMESLVFVYPNSNPNSSDLTKNLIALKTVLIKEYHISIWYIKDC